MKSKKLVISGICCILFGTGLLSSQNANAEEVKDYTQFVDPFVGTAVDNGQQFPGAVAPHGIVKLSPDTYPHKNDDHAGYDYNKLVIQGFSHTRVEGVGGQGSGGDVLVTPTYVEYTQKPTASSKAQTYSHDNESATPGYYSVELSPKVGTDNDVKEDTSFGNIKAELTASTRAGIHKYTFPKAGKASLLIDLNYTYHGTDVRNAILDSKTENGKTMISGQFSGKNVSGNGKYTLFYYIETETPITSLQTWNGDILSNSDKESGNDIGAILNFDVEQGQQVDLKVGISTISAEQAKKDMSVEVADKSFDDIRTETKASWNDLLKKVDVESTEVSDPDEKNKRLLYTSLYRMFTLPVNATSTDGTYMGTDRVVYKTNGYTHYDSWTLWDDFKKYPMIGMVAPDVYKNIIQSIANMLNTGIDTWGSDTQSVMTVRNEHAVALLADGIAKGYTDIDGLEGAYEAAKKIANDAVTSSVEKQGYFTGRVDKTVEYAYDDWCLSIIADSLGKTDEAEKYLTRSFNYMNLYKADAVTADGTTMGLLWPKNSDGTWKSANPEKYGDNSLYQGTLWQYTWFDSNDIGGITTLLGGKDKLLTNLRYLYGMQDPDNGSRMLHTNTNEIDLQTPYYFNYAGKPSDTQYWVRNIYTKRTWNRYSGTGEFNPPIYDYVYKLAPDGFMETMDEDGGTMSAMFFSAAVGIFPMTPGDTSYQIGTPFFDKVTLDIGNGKTFEIVANNVSDDNYYIQSSKLNGKSFDQSWIDYTTIANGGKIEFEMGDEPSTWAEDGLAAISSSDDVATDSYSDDAISYSTKTFKEGTANDGSIETSILVNVKDATFKGNTTDDLVKNGAIEAKNVPSGLTLEAKKINDTQLELTLAGKADNHNLYDSIDNLAVTLTDAVLSKSVETNFRTMQLRVNFNDPTISSNKTTVKGSSKNDSSVDETIKLKLTGDSFVGKADENFVETGKVTINNLPEGLTANLTYIDANTLELSFDGKAKDHSEAAKNINVLFEDSAFKNSKAVDVYGSSKSGLQSFVILFEPNWKELIQQLIKEAEAKDKTNYTPSSVSELEKNITEAKTIVSNESATDDELKDMYTKLETSYQALAIKKVRNGFTRLEGEDSDYWTDEKGINGALKNESTNLGNTFDGAWIAYEDVRFSKSPDFISINYSSPSNRTATDGKIRVYADRIDETQLLTEVKIPNTSSWSDYQMVTSRITNNELLSDVEDHDLIIQFKGTTNSNQPYICNLDYIEMSSIKPLGKIEFESYNDWSAGAMKSETSTDSSGNSLGNIGGSYNGAWLKYSNIDFGTDGISSIDVRYSSKTSGTGKNARVEFYLDDMTSEPFSTVMVPGTGDNWANYQIVSEAISDKISGVHTVYAVLKEDDGNKYVANLDYFVLNKVEEADTSKLVELLNNAKEYKEADYTIESFANLQTEIINAQSVLDNEQAIQDDVDKAYEKLNDAIQQLEPKKEEVIEVESFEINTTALTVLKVGKTLDLGVKITPENATDKTITWTIAKPDIASIEDGKLKAKKAGITTITGVTTNGKKASFTLRVTQ